MVSTDASRIAEQNRQTFDTLVRWAQTAPNMDEAWIRLEAAHVVGQRELKAHALSHWYMLKLAVRTGDAAECVGQVFRLLLVPLGHLTGRLPMGNPGRASVSAFAPMPVRSELRQLIAQAREGRQTPLAETGRVAGEQ